MAAFVATIVVAVGLTAVVVGHDRDAPNRAAAAGVTAVTVAVPPEILLPVPPTFGPAPTRGTGPRRITEDQVQVALEQAIKRTTGWTHKVVCSPEGVLAGDEVLSCRAQSEPPIREVEPTLVLAVVQPGGERVLWVRGTTGALSSDALTTEGKGCADLRAAGFSWVAAVAYDAAWDHPETIDRDPDGRPCVAEFGPDEVAEAEGRALTL